VQTPSGHQNDGIFLADSQPGATAAALPQFTDLTDAQNLGSDTWYNAFRPR
jgi:hypothetical protein